MQEDVEIENHTMRKEIRLAGLTEWLRNSFMSGSSRILPLIIGPEVFVWLIMLRCHSGKI
jgi:hypothetical protein